MEAVAVLSCTSYDQGKIRTVPYRIPMEFDWIIKGIECASISTPMAPLSMTPAAFLFESYGFHIRILHSPFEYDVLSYQ